MNVLSDFSLIGFFKRGVFLLAAPLVLMSVGVKAQITEPVVNEHSSTSQVTADTALTQELMSVRALMRMEMALALARTRQQSAHSNKNTEPHRDVASRLELPVSELRLTAIYGTGSKLVAEVQAGTRTLTYINGKSWPVGVTSGKTAYRLISMKGRCLTLARKEQSERVCMEIDSRGAP
jgi:hypothetical protein